MKNQNVVLDFTINKSIENQTGGQPLAIMPSELAKKLLKMYADKLVKASAYNIIAEFRDKLIDCKTVNESVVCALEYVQERDLIGNCAAENWDAYKVEIPNTNDNPIGYEMTE